MSDCLCMLGRECVEIGSLTLGCQGRFLKKGNKNNDGLLPDSQLSMLWVLPVIKEMLILLIHI